MYKLLFLLICIGVGIYLNRRNFTNFYRTFLGIPVPSSFIAAGMSVVIGFFLWIVALLLLWQFRPNLF
ncbi:MAG: hypothetical protein ABIO02_05025 [Patescibacteria group bacterium]